MVIMKEVMKPTKIRAANFVVFFDNNLTRVTPFVVNPCGKLSYCRKALGYITSSPTASVVWTNFILKVHQG